MSWLVYSPLVSDAYCRSNLQVSVNLETFNVLGGMIQRKYEAKRSYSIWEVKNSTYDTNRPQVTTKVFGTNIKCSLSVC